MQQPLLPERRHSATTFKKNWALIGLLSFFAYRLLFQPIDTDCITDRLHDLTASINDLMHTDSEFDWWMMLTGQLLIDGHLIWTAWRGAIKSKNMLSGTSVGILFGLRYVFLQIQKLPYPDQIIWDSPGVPTIGVPYGITRDFFYSGHTGFMIMATFMTYRAFRNPISLVLELCCTLFIMFLVLMTRVHYSIDVVGAIIFSFWINQMVSTHLIQVDKMYSAAYYFVLKVYERFKRPQAHEPEPSQV